MLKTEEIWETDEAICIKIDIPGLKDDNMDGEAKEDGFDESNGAESNVGGSTVLVLAACLHIEQKVLHVIC